MTAMEYLENYKIKTGYYHTWQQALGKLSFNKLRRNTGLRQIPREVLDSSFKTHLHIAHGLLMRFNMDIRSLAGSTDILINRYLAGNCKMANSHIAIVPFGNNLIPVGIKPVEGLGLHPVTVLSYDMMVYDDDGSSIQIIDLLKKLPRFTGPKSKTYNAILKKIINGDTQ